MKKNQMYCLVCKKAVVPKDGDVKMTKKSVNKRQMMMACGKCGKCGNNIRRFVSKKDFDAKKSKSTSRKSRKPKSSRKSRKPKSSRKVAKK